MVCVMCETVGDSCDLCSEAFRTLSLDLANKTTLSEKGINKVVWYYGWNFDTWKRDF